MEHLVASRQRWAAANGREPDSFALVTTTPRNGPEGPQGIGTTKPSLSDFVQVDWEGGVDACLEATRWLEAGGAGQVESAVAAAFDMLNKVRRCKVGAK